MPGPGDRGFIYLGPQDEGETVIWDDKGAREASFVPATSHDRFNPSLSGPAPRFSNAGMGGSVQAPPPKAVAPRPQAPPDYEAMIHALEQQALKDQASASASPYVKVR